MKMPWGNCDVRVSLPAMETFTLSLTDDTAHRG